MNGSHVAAASGITTNLAALLVWATHWPLHPLDQETALAIAGLVIALFGGGGIAYLNARKPGPPPAAD